VPTDLALGGRRGKSKQGHALNILVGMSSPASDRGAARPLDAIALARVRRRLQRQAEPPWLHGEVARRMGERLSIIKLHPARILDWGAFVGAGRGVLSQQYPKARVTAVEADEERRAATAAAAAGRLPWWKSVMGQEAAPTLRPSEVAGGDADLLWANMTLQGVLDPEREMQTWHRSLAVEGFVMFSTLGPGSLRGLAELYAAERWNPPFAPFVDMHDLGDMLVHAGFADPVMDQETITLTWASAQALLTELRSLGGNVDPRRAPALRTPRWRARLESALHKLSQPDGRIALSFEVVYGHAFKAAPRPRVSGETAVSLDDMRAMVRRPRAG
jgi:malonyl-CoA O-methyltransferase